MEEKSWKLAVVGIIFKRRISGAVLIMTQLRLVQNKDYDPISDRTWEGVGETVKSGESVFDALIRGVREECGDQNFKPLAIYGADETRWTTGKGDEMHAHNPLCFTQNLKVPQPWAGPLFAVEVSAGWEPNYRLADGEAGDHLWWTPDTLLGELENHPEKFHCFHFPGFVKICQEAISRRL